MEEERYQRPLYRRTRLTLTPGKNMAVFWQSNIFLIPSLLQATPCYPIWNLIVSSLGDPCTQQAIDPQIGFRDEEFHNLFCTYKHFTEEKRSSVNNNDRQGRICVGQPSRRPAGRQDGRTGRVTNLLLAAARRKRKCDVTPRLFFRKPNMSYRELVLFQCLAFQEEFYIWRRFFGGGCWIGIFCVKFQRWWLFVVWFSVVWKVVGIFSCRPMNKGSITGIHLEARTSSLSTITRSELNSLLNRERQRNGERERGEVGGVGRGEEGWQGEGVKAREGA